MSENLPEVSVSALDAEGYERAMKRIDELFHVMEGTLEADELMSLVDAVEAYEDRCFPIGVPTAEEAAQFRREQEIDSRS